MIIAFSRLWFRSRQALHLKLDVLVSDISNLTCSRCPSLARFTTGQINAARICLYRHCFTVMQLRSDYRCAGNFMKYTGYVFSGKTCSLSFTDNYFLYSGYMYTDRYQYRAEYILTKINFLIKPTNLFYVTKHLD